MDCRLANIHQGGNVKVKGETAVLPKVHKIYPGDGVATAVLPAANEVFPGDGVGWKRPFCPQLTKISQVVGGNGRSACSLRSLARWWGGNGQKQ